MSPSNNAHLLSNPPTVTQGIEREMAKLPDESVDSRTSTASRKRGLEESPESNESVASEGIGMGDGQSSESLPKRVKTFGAMTLQSFQTSQEGADVRGFLEEEIKPSSVPAGLMNLKHSRPAHFPNYDSGSTPAFQHPVLQEESHYYNSGPQSQIAPVDQPADLNNTITLAIEGGLQLYKDDTPTSNDTRSRREMAQVVSVASRSFSKKQILAFDNMTKEKKASLAPEERKALQLASERRLQSIQDARSMKNLMMIQAKKDRKAANHGGERFQKPKLPQEEKNLNGSNLQDMTATRSRNQPPLLRPPGVPTYKRLNQKELEALSSDEKNQYNLAKQLDVLERNKGRMAKLTASVEKLIAAQGWPLQNNQELMSQMNSGASYFPHKYKPSTLRYGNKSGWFTLREVLYEGKPIQVQDFSFSIFVIAFLIENQDKWDVLTQKVLVSAFSIYINNVYGHILPLAGWLRHSAEAPGALALSAAKREVTRIMTGVPRDSVPMMSALHGDHHLAASQASNLENNRPAGKLEQGTLTPKDSLPINDHRLDESTGEDIEKDYQIAGLETPNIATYAGNQGNVTMLGSERPSTPSSRSTNVSTPVNVEVLMDTEVHLQQKYFPSTNDGPVVPRCLACTSTGHGTWNCPNLTCTLCGDSAGHSNSACPLQQRCGKCRERGHAAAECPEKLGLAQAEAVPCDLCGSTDHLERACSMIWRSFVPKLEEIQVVLDVPIHCYSCGGSGHYGPECGIHQGQPLSGAVTWSRENLLKYVDLDSQNRAISAGVDYTIHSRSQRSFSIKEKANDPITLDDSDDDGQNFIRPKVNASANQNRQIEFGSVAGLPAGTRQQALRASRSIFGQGSHHATVSIRYERERTYSPPRFGENNSYHNVASSVPARTFNGGPPGRGKGRGRGAMQAGRGTNARKPRGNKSGRNNV